jgi:hypothetical protein
MKVSRGWVTYFYHHGDDHASRVAIHAMHNVVFVEKTDPVPFTNTV